jgi:hypothetical protein
MKHAMLAVKNVPKYYFKQELLLVLMEKWGENFHHYIIPD